MRTGCSATGATQRRSASGFEALSDGGNGVALRPDAPMTVRAIAGLALFNVFVLIVGACVLFGLRG